MAGEYLREGSVMLDVLEPFGPLHILVLHIPIGGFVALWFAWLARSNRQRYVYSKSFLTLNLFLLLSTGLGLLATSSGLA